MSRDARLLLQDIEDACGEVAAIVSGVDYDAFAGSIEKVAAIERKLFVIGEACARLPESFREAQSHIEWRPIIGMRNVLAHAYWRVDRKVLWDAATRSVPELVSHVRALLQRP